MTTNITKDIYTHLITDPSFESAPPTVCAHTGGAPFNPGFATHTWCLHTLVIYASNDCSCSPTQTSAYGTSFFLIIRTLYHTGRQSTSSLQKTMSCLLINFSQMIGRDYEHTRRSLRWAFMSIHVSLIPILNFDRYHMLSSRSCQVKKSQLSVKHYRHSSAWLLCGKVIRKTCPHTLRWSRLAWKSFAITTSVHWMSQHISSLFVSDYHLCYNQSCTDMLWQCSIRQRSLTGL